MPLDRLGKGPEVSFHGISSGENEKHGRAGVPELPCFLLKWFSAVPLRGAIRVGHPSGGGLIQGDLSHTGILHSEIAS